MTIQVVDIPVAIDRKLIEEANSLWRRQIEARRTLGDVDLDANVTINFANKSVKFDVATVVDVSHNKRVVVTVLDSYFVESNLDDLGIKSLVPPSCVMETVFYVAVAFVYEPDDSETVQTLVYHGGRDTAQTVLEVLAAAFSQVRL